MPARETRHGIFRPKNPKKYKGDPTKIVYRSGWELRYMVHLDQNPNVVQWSSEEIVIPYTSPLDLEIHRYFPDLWVKVRKPNGAYNELLIEIKPYKQSIEPKIPDNKKMTPKRKASFLEEIKTWGVNEAKWKAARAYCKTKGWTFLVITEREIFGD